ncbi:MAG: hypothetical protein WC470_01115 [Candidatus Paceibacterota bacterium]
MKVREKNGSMHVIELEHEDQVQLIVPASMERVCIYLTVTPSGKLEIVGGASIIDTISGKGMKSKVKEN